MNPSAANSAGHGAAAAIGGLPSRCTSSATAWSMVRQAPFPSPYTGSPSSGMPIPEAEWTLSWWVRPVTGRNSTSARAPDSATTRHWVSAGLPFYAGIIRQPSAALLILASASSIVPCFASGIPARMPR